MVSRVFSINTKCQILVYRSLFNRPNSPEQFLAHTRAESLEPKPRISRSTDILRAWTAVVMRTLRRFGSRNLPGHTFRYLKHRQWTEMEIRSPLQTGLCR